MIHNIAVQRVLSANYLITNRFTKKASSPKLFHGGRRALLTASPSVLCSPSRPALVLRTSAEGNKRAKGRRRSCNSGYPWGTATRMSAENTVVLAVEPASIYGVPQPFSRHGRPEAQSHTTSSSRPLLPEMDSASASITSKQIPGTERPSSRDRQMERLTDWNLEMREDTPSYENLVHAAALLRTADIPVAFPTETVYGLGADATRSAAVRGIYAAKQRPSDNPLIVHIHSLKQLRKLLRPFQNGTAQGTPEAPLPNSSALENHSDPNTDPIPSIYHPLIQRFWPGPLTIILPNPSPSRLAPEVTAGLSTFGARMPSNPLALALLKLADVPVAAPSANSSSKPSPTSAAHVLHDLNGRIHVILDGGDCDVGVESTVVNGLCDSPAVLRPGGIGIEEIRQCQGWERVVVGWKDGRSDEKAGQGERPLAPGMKYRHYSPKARVVLFEAASAHDLGSDGVRRVLMEMLVDAATPTAEMGSVAADASAKRKMGVVRTTKWKSLRPTEDEITVNGSEARQVTEENQINAKAVIYSLDTEPSSVVSALTQDSEKPVAATTELDRSPEQACQTFQIHDIALGHSPRHIARHLFSSLRDLDLAGVETIFVEGIDDQTGEVAAAVMNRLRKAAEVIL